MNNKGVLSIMVIIISGILLVVTVYSSILKQNEKSVNVVDDEKYYYFIPEQESQGHKVMSYNLPRIGEEVYSGNKFYIVERVVHNLDSKNTSVYCRLK